MSVSRTPSRTTPGRRKNATKENVYFEVGKQGRKTGITVPDNGARDENGFEHVSHLFSSPHKLQSPPKEPLIRRTRSSIANGASDLQPRKTPRLPPPKSQTPRHTNIGGSPVRHSSVKPASPVRVLRDEQRTPTRAQSEVINSIERDQSPIIMRSAMNARLGKGRKSIFDVPELRTPQAPSSPPPGAIEEVSQILNINDDDGMDMPPPELNDSLPTLEDSLPEPSSTSSRQHGEPNTKRKRGARRSDVSTSATEDLSQVSSEPRSSAKRRRTAMDTSAIEPSPSQNTRSAVRSSMVAPEATMISNEPNEEISEQPYISPPPMDDEVPDMSRPPSVSPTKRGRPRSRKSLSLPSTRRRTASRAVASTSNPRIQRESTTRTTVSAYSPALGEAEDEDDDVNTTRMGSIRLRSATPFEDSGARITRSGRASIKPLAYWKNETYVYRQGEIDGVIRAEDIEQPRKRKGGVKKGKNKRKLGKIEEESDEEHEDLWPEAWEEDTQIIKGPVRAWDEELRAGGVEEVVEEIAYASRAIKTSEVAGGQFRYAKVLTSEFFGAGVVEIPPGGIKRSKNSRKMQMAFFVHEGKVSVTVAGMDFGITAGGVWHVPRGNNYAIQNDSTVFPAKIFFAQGCEWDARVARVAAAAAEAAKEHAHTQ
ncbi:Mif2/CENP-C-like protein [Elsinoe fawcettii]|nr:Mif2/CENP-C-like protein [Elsinoe fawcettii]